MKKKNLLPLTAIPVARSLILCVPKDLGKGVSYQSCKKEGTGNCCPWQE